ncbi:MAG: hypothetical protein ABI746_07665 [Dermatophilaceae bacterium]
MPVWMIDAAIIGLGALAAVLVGSRLVRKVFWLVERRSRAGAANSANSAKDPDKDLDGALDNTAHDQTQGAPSLDDPDMLPGGQWIGYLERLAVFATLTAGWKEGLALILAIKGLARYPELALSNSRTAEKFIIGTLASVLFAASCAGITAWLTGLTR